MINGSEEYDLQNENFDIYVSNTLSEMTEYERTLLPTKLMLKICTRTGSFNPKKANKMSFFEKIYALWKAKGRRFYIVVEDEENGLSHQKFQELRENIAKTKKTQKQMDDPFEKAKIENHFVLGSKELCDTFSYMNKINCSPFFNYLIKTKNSPTSNIAKYKQEMNYIIRFVCQYEAQKKKLHSNLKINMPESLVLLYLYDGEQKVSSTIHNSVFKYCYQSAPSKIKQAFITLQQKGLIVKTGRTANAKLSITEIGKEKANELILKAVNF
jgi:hypothetical protein